MESRDQPGSPRSLSMNAFLILHTTTWHQISVERGDTYTLCFISENRCLCTRSEQPCVAQLTPFHTVYHILGLVSLSLISFCLTIWLFVLFSDKLGTPEHPQGLTSPPPTNILF